MQPSTYELPLLKKEQTAKDVVSFYFDRKNTQFDFIPGQYMRVILPGVENDPRGNSRMFSLASSPTQKEYIMITTKITQSPFKQRLLSLRQGEGAQFFGPVGRFILDVKDTRPHILVAGGIGMTPFHSMLVYAAEKNLSIPITLFVSFSAFEDFLYFEELKELTARHSHLRTIYTISHAEAMPSLWKGETGRITSEMITRYSPDFSNAVFYICGSDVVIKALEEMVLSMGVLKENIKKEQFVGY